MSEEAAGKLKAADKLRLGIAGCGDIARYTALFARLNPRIRLQACCDVSQQQADAFARRFHIPQAYSSYEQMLAGASLDAVYLAIPHDLHAGMLCAAIQGGLPVLVEKPITRTLAEGKGVARLAQERGVKVAVNYQYRYDAGCYALARAVQRGDLGKIHYASASIPWSRQQAYFTRSPWHASLERAGGGTLLTQGSHMLDVILWATGKKPCSAVGFTAQSKFEGIEVEDLALGILELEGGVPVNISSTMAAAAEQALRIEIHGEQASAIYSDRPLPHVRFVGRRIARERPPVWGFHALQRSLEGFCRWVMGGSPHLVPAVEALPVLGAVEAIYRSARSGRRELVENCLGS